MTWLLGETAEVAGIAHLPCYSSVGKIDRKRDELTSVAKLAIADMLEAGLAMI